MLNIVSAYDRSVGAELTGSAQYAVAATPDMAYAQAQAAY